MNKYSVIIQPKAIDELSKIEKRTAKGITSKLTRLSEDVEALNLLHLHGKLSDFYKLQFGDYRIVYEINHTKKVITVQKIGHRRVKDLSVKGRSILYRTGIQGYPLTGKTKHTGLVPPIHLSHGKWYNTSNHSASVVLSRNFHFIYAVCRAKRLFALHLKVAECLISDATFFLRIVLSINCRIKHVI